MIGPPISPSDEYANTTRACCERSSRRAASESVDIFSAGVRAPSITIRTVAVVRPAADCSRSTARYVCGAGVVSTVAVRVARTLAVGAVTIVAWLGRSEEGRVGAGGRARGAVAQDRQPG